jgi:hypothetical protein
MDGLVNVPSRLRPVSSPPSSCILHCHERVRPAPPPDPLSPLARLIRSSCASTRSHLEKVLLGVTIACSQAATKSDEVGGRKMRVAREALSSLDEKHLQSILHGVLYALFYSNLLECIYCRRPVAWKSLTAHCLIPRLQQLQSSVRVCGQHERPVSSLSGASERRAGSSAVPAKGDLGAELRHQLRGWSWIHRTERERERRPNIQLWASSLCGCEATLKRLWMFSSLQPSTSSIASDSGPRASRPAHDGVLISGPARIPGRISATRIVERSAVEHIHRRRRCVHGQGRRRSDVALGDRTTRDTGMCEVRPSADAGLPVVPRSANRTRIRSERFLSSCAGSLPLHLRVQPHRVLLERGAAMLPRPAARVG